MATFTATTPAKLILMGEHAAVYGRPALVAALGLETRVELEVGRCGDVVLDLETLNHREATDWSAVLAYTKLKRRAWRRYAAEPSPESFSEVKSEDPAHVVKTALGETVCDVGGLDPAKLPGVRLKVSSEIPVGSGFGSSASVAVAVIAVLLNGLEALETSGMRPSEQDTARILRIALEVERRQHGLPSGADHSAVLLGGVLRLEPVAGSASPGVTPLEVTQDSLSGLRVFDTGQPNEGTGEVVADVRRRRERDPIWFEANLDAMENATREFERLLVASAPDTDLGSPIRDFERCLEGIEVVPAAVASRVRVIEQGGGSAKISGAGTLGETGAGALLVYHPSHLSGLRKAGYIKHEENDLMSSALRDYVAYSAEIGAAGLRLGRSGANEDRS